jgi:hypothetical protein
MAQPTAQKHDGHDDPATDASSTEIAFAAVKILPSSYPRVMGMLVGLSASAGGDDLFARIKARPQTDGDLLLVIPMPDGTRRELQVPAGEWRLLAPEEREQASSPAPSAFDLRDRKRR